MNYKRYSLIIDNKTLRDENHSAIQYGGAYYAYNKLAELLQRGVAKSSIQVIDIDTKEIIVSVDIKRVVTE